MSKEINLKSILESELSEWIPAFEFDNPSDSVSLDRALFAMKEACRQALELAAENACIINTGCGIWGYDEVDKESILETINQIK